MDFKKNIKNEGTEKSDAWIQIKRINNILYIHKCITVILPMKDSS